jgi:hypothetical protein
MDRMSTDQSTSRRHGVHSEEIMRTNILLCAGEIEHLCSASLRLCERIFHVRFSFFARLCDWREYSGLPQNSARRIAELRVRSIFLRNASMRFSGLEQSNAGNCEDCQNPNLRHSNIAATARIAEVRLAAYPVLALAVARTDLSEDPYANHRAFGLQGNDSSSKG